MRIAAIFAMSLNRVIGKNNQLPWHLPADLQHFKKTTWGKPVLLGRKTFISIGRALPGRINVVVTHDVNFQAPGCLMAHTLEQALALVEKSEEIFIIGGADLYKQLLPITQRLYMTLVHHTFAGDVFFPELSLTEWHEIERIDHAADQENAYAYSFITLERERP